jgi:ribosomal protein S18 acetylase RimI-like enzyme
MSTLSFRPIEDRDVDAVVTLWGRAGLTRPHNDPQRDIAFARAAPSSEILVGEAEGRIVTSVLVGHDGHRGTVYYVSVDPDFRGRDYGRQVMAAAEEWLKAQGIWKLNLLIREDNTAVQGFYAAIGYEVEPRVAMARWLDPSKRGGA